MRRLRGFVAVALGLGICWGILGCSDSSTTSKPADASGKTKDMSKMRDMMPPEAKENLLKQEHKPEDKPKTDGKSKGADSPKG
jgi:hypothetical protein